MIPAQTTLKIVKNSLSNGKGFEGQFKSYNMSIFDLKQPLV